MVFITVRLLERFIHGLLYPFLSGPKLLGLSLPARPARRWGPPSHHPAAGLVCLKSISHLRIDLLATSPAPAAHARRQRRRRTLHQRLRLRHPAAEHAGRFEVRHFPSTSSSLSPAVLQRRGQEIRPPPRLIPFAGKVSQLA